jgi:hypothetical protein
VGYGGRDQACERILKAWFYWSSGGVRGVGKVRREWKKGNQMQVEDAFNKWVPLAGERGEGEWE